MPPLKVVDRLDKRREQAQAGLENALRAARSSRDDKKLGQVRGMRKEAAEGSAVLQDQQEAGAGGGNVDGSCCSILRRDYERG